MRAIKNAVNVTAVVFLTGINTVFGAALPPLDIPVCEKPPMLDGTLDDPVWQQAVRVERLYLLNSDQLRSDTTFYLIRDDHWLYLGVRAVNPRMPQVSQRMYLHNSLVYKDDSVEIVIRPDPAGDRFYHFALSFANVQHFKRMDKSTGERNFACPMPWRSMTRRLPDGWTATIAIPLYALECADLAGLQINLCRNFMMIDHDAQGAIQGEKIEYQMLKPGNRGSYHNFANFRTVAGMGGFEPKVPFAPQIVGAEVTGVLQEGGQNFYIIKLTMALATPVSGTARVRVVEVCGDRESEALARPVELNGPLEMELRVPAGVHVQDRKIKVVLADNQNGDLLALRVLEDLSALDVIRKAFVGRSYYTDEEFADIRVELGLPESMLARAALAVEVNGKKIVGLAGLQALMTPSVPLAALAMGDNPVKVRVTLDGKELAVATLNILRLAPRPGFEVKCDFIKGIVMKGGQPFFPVGIITGSSFDCDDDAIADEFFRFFHNELGLNVFVRGKHWPAEIPDQQETAKQAERLARLAALTARHGVNLFDRSPPPPRLLPAQESMPLPVRLRLQRERYLQQEPIIKAEAAITRDLKHFLGYSNVDEPNLGDSDLRIAQAEWYWKTVTAIDQYRPLFLLYSQNIPHGDNWTRWGHILGYDIYPRPFLGGLLGDPGLYTAYHAYALRARCRRDNKVMWFMPLASMLTPDRTPVGMSRAHMLCQAYTAIIYGARGLLYYVLQFVTGEEARDALRIISAQVREIGPALLNGDIAQNIKYTPDELRPRQQKFPMVNAAVFKYPAGDYLLLAANIKPFAVDTKFTIGGIKSGIRLFDEDGKKGLGGWVSQLFGSKGKVKLNGESFTDKIEPYGVRAYKIKLADNPGPVQGALDMTAMEDECVAAVDIWGIVRQVRAGKNYCPNPCFQRQYCKGIPDFYRPYSNGGTNPRAGQRGSEWYVDETNLWEGRPAVRMSHPPAQTVLSTRGMMGVCYPPVADKPTRMTFSFYAKGATPDDVVSLQLIKLAPGKRKKFKLTLEWRRYHLTVDVPPPETAVMGGRWYVLVPAFGATVWVSGLQLETGDAPTEFQDDSVIKKSN